jgi:iron complex transport system substrate-binding protein
VRIVSLLPSTTEILFAIGGGDDVVGVTFECDFPLEARSRRIVSTSSLPEGLSPAAIDAEVRSRINAGEDLYHLDEGALRELGPDLVVTQDLCAVCAVAVDTVDAAMEHLGCDSAVLTVDPGTLTEVLESVVTIGKVTGRDREASRLVGRLTARLAEVERAVAGRPRPKVAVIEWTDPLYSAGHWVPDMVQAAGGASVLGDSGQRSERLPPDALGTCGADLVVVAPCGYALADAVRLAEDLLETTELPPTTSVWAVDANAAFARPGPRIVDGIEALAAICHPLAAESRPDIAALVRQASP